MDRHRADHLHYQWLRCDVDGDNCVDDRRRHDDDYALTPDDVGYDDPRHVTATNAVGTSTDSRPSPRSIAAAPPTPAPDRLRHAADGQTLPPTPAPGPAPRRSPSTTSGFAATPPAPTASNIGGATGETYTLDRDDVGHDLRVLVTASNVGRQRVGHLARRPRRRRAPPVDHGLPVISGDAEDGRRSPPRPAPGPAPQPIAFTYQWQRCDAAARTARTSPARPPRPTR